MEPRPPEGLDGVDVPHAGDPALVEQERLERCALAPSQELGQPAHGERARERLDADRFVERGPGAPGAGGQSPPTFGGQTPPTIENGGVDDDHATELARV